MNEDIDQLRLVQIGKNIRSIREKLELSQDDLVSRCEVTKRNLSKIENGKKNLLVSTLYEIAKGLGVMVKELLDFK